MSGDEIERFCAVPGGALLVVAAALIDPDGQVMLQQRPAGRQHGGLWEFPGGKVEPGEGPVAALVRELREELAIEIMPGDCVPLGFSANEKGLAAGKGARGRAAALRVPHLARRSGQSGRRGACVVHARYAAYSRYAAARHTADANRYPVRHDTVLNPV